MEPRPPSAVTRRHFLRATTLTLGGLGLADLLRLRAEAREAGRTVEDTSVILLWLPGGPPHMETYDMKPDAPAEYRGDFKPIPTNVPGMEVCEHLPRHARIADKYTLLRSISHNFADHGGGHKRFLTGRDPKQPTGFVNDFPMVGSMTAKIARAATSACRTTFPAWTRAAATWTYSVSAPPTSGRRPRRSPWSATPTPRSSRSRTWP